MSDGVTVVAAVLGLVYCYGREKYFNGYVQDAKLRSEHILRCMPTLEL